MKKFLCLAAAVLCLFACLTGCRPPRTVSVRESEGTKIYFVRKDEDGRKYMDYERCEIKVDDLSARIDQILDALKAPKSKGAYLCVPEFISVGEAKLTGNVLHLDFTRSYRYLEPEPKLVVATLICRTILEDGLAQYIKITCEGEEQAPVYSGYIHKGKMYTEEKIYLE